MLSESYTSLFDKRIGEKLLFLVDPDKETPFHIPGFLQHGLPFDGLPDGLIDKTLYCSIDIFADICWEFFCYLKNKRGEHRRRGVIIYT